MLSYENKILWPSFVIQAKPFDLKEKSVSTTIVSKKWVSSTYKWDGQLKTTKREIQDYMIWELYGIRNYITKI